MYNDCFNYYTQCPWNRYIIYNIMLYKKRRKTDRTVCMKRDKWQLNNFHLFTVSTINTMAQNNKFKIHKIFYSITIVLEQKNENKIYIYLDSIYRYIHIQNKLDSVFKIKQRDYRTFSRNYTSSRLFYIHVYTYVINNIYTYIYIHLHHRYNLYSSAAICCLI